MRARKLAMLLLVVLGCHRAADKSEPESAKVQKESPDPKKETAAGQGAESTGKEDDEKEGAAKNIKVRCASLSTQLVRDRIELHGTVVPLPDRDAQIAPQVAGRLVKVLVREGDMVKQGQVVAQVDPGPLSDQLNEAQAQVAKAAAEEQNAQVTLARVERVFQRGIAARQEVDDAAARAAGARAAQAQASAALHRAQRQVDFAAVRSPLPGVVLRVLHHTGELVDGTPATVVVEVGDPSALELVGDATAQDLVQLARSAPAVVVFAALPGRSWSGSVAAVAPAVDRATGLGKVRVALQIVDQAHGVTPPVGLYGTAKILVGEPRPGLMVPAVALRNRSELGAEVVVCGKDGEAHVRRLQLVATPGAATDLLVEVRSPSGDGEPLGPMDRVAVEPVLGIGEGDKLDVAGTPPIPTSNGGGHD